MAVSDDEKRLMAQAIQLKRELVRLKSQIDRELKAHAGPPARLDGRPLDPDSLPPPPKGEIPPLPELHPGAGRAAPQCHPGGEKPY